MHQDAYVGDVSQQDEAGAGGEDGVAAAAAV